MGGIRVLYPNITPEEASEIMLPPDGGGNGGRSSGPESDRP